MPVTVARLNISVRHIRAIVPALSPAPRDALTESPIPACRGLFRLIHKKLSYEHSTSKDEHKHSYNPILLRALAREGARDAAQLRRLLP